MEMEDIKHDTGRRCGSCGAPIPITNISVGRPTFWNKHPVTHFWCYNCEAITVVRPVVFEKWWLDFIHKDMENRRKMYAEAARAEEVWKRHLSTKEGGSNT